MRVLGRGGWIGALLLGFGALLGGAWYAAQKGLQSGAPESVPTRKDALAPAVVYYQHTEYIRTKQDEIRWKLVVDKSILHRNESVTLEGLREAIYYKDNEALVSLRGDRAYFNHQTKNLVVKGNIHVTSSLGLLLECDELRWIDREQKLVCPQIKRARYRTASLQTRRLYFWVEKNEIEFPDPLQVEDVDLKAKAQRATANLKTYFFDLYGPAEVIMMASLEENLTKRPSLPRRAGVRRWLAWGLLGLLGTPALAQPPAEAVPGPSASAGAKKSSRRKVLLHLGKGGQVQWNYKTNAFKARNNVKVAIPDDDVEIWCDRADYTGDEGEKKGVLTATGNLRMKDPENELTGKLLTVYVEEKRAVITDNVVLVHTPKDRPPEAEGSRADKYRYSPTTMTCDKIEYWYKTGQRRGIATGNLKFQQKDLNGTAEKATFYNEDQIVDLEGQVHFEDSEGQAFDAPLLRILLEEEEILFQGPMQGIFYPEEEGGEAAPETEEETPPGPQAPPFSGFEEGSEGPSSAPEEAEKAEGTGG